MHQQALSNQVFYSFSIVQGSLKSPNFGQEKSIKGIYNFYIAKIAQGDTVNPPSEV